MFTQYRYHLQIRQQCRMTFTIWKETFKHLSRAEHLRREGYRKGGKKHCLLPAFHLVSWSRHEPRGTNTPKLYLGKGGSNAEQQPHKTYKELESKALIQVRESSLREDSVGLTIAQSEWTQDEGRQAFWTNRRKESRAHGSVTTKRKGSWGSVPFPLGQSKKATFRIHLNTHTHCTHTSM